MHFPQRGRAPLLLLALSLSIFSAGALPAPQPSQKLSTLQRDEIGAAAGDALLVGGGAVATAGAALPGRSLLKKPTKPPAPKPPLPNFEIGVPAPPKEQLKEWQRSGVREHRQELSSSSFLLPKHPGTDYVALCVIARDAHADVLEWLNHHIRLGVGRVYLWDHASEPPMKEIVQGYIDAGLVEYEHFTQVQHPSGKPQMHAYDGCLARHGHKHTWMGFIDVDEFLMFRDPWPAVQSLPALLQEFEGPGAPPQANSGLAVHWIIFGSSGHERRPAGGTLRSYTRCIRLWHAQHALVKTIVRTACTMSAEGPHNFRHNCSLPVLQTNKAPIHGARSDEPVHTRLALHHYAIKSKAEFELKMLRGSAMKRQRGWEYFAFIDEWSTEFNFDGLAVWDTQEAYHTYPGITQQQLARYSQEQHEDFWLKGADDPRYKEQLRQQEAAKKAEAAAGAAAAGAQQVQEAQQQAQQAAAGAVADVDGGVAAGVAALGTAAQQGAGQQQQQQPQRDIPDPAGAAAAGTAGQHAADHHHQQQQQRAIPDLAGVAAQRQAGAGAGQQHLSVHAVQR